MNSIVDKVELAEKIILITGGSKGIGAGMVKWFAKRSKQVIIADIDKESGENLATQFKNTHFIELHVESPKSVQNVVKTIYLEFGKIDVLINNAAISKGDSFLETSIDKWIETININLNGVFFVSQEVAKQMIQNKIKGKIINIASVNSFAAERKASPYVASKGGVNQLTKSMAVDLAEYEINVNAIAPGPIITNNNEDYFNSEPMATGIKKGVPVGRPGVPEDIASLAGYLASDECPFINGSTIVVDGGFTAYLRQD